MESAKRVATKIAELMQRVKSFEAPKSEDESPVFNKTDTDELFRTHAVAHAKIGKFCREQRKNPATCGVCCSYSDSMIKDSSSATLRASAVKNRKKNTRSVYH